MDAAIIHSSLCFPSSSSASFASTNFSKAFAIVPCFCVMAFVREFYRPTPAVKDLGLKRVHRLGLFHLSFLYSYCQGATFH